MRSKRRRGWIWAISLLAAAAVLAALLSSLFQLAVQAVPGYRQKVERQVSRDTGYPVEIGSMSLAWRGLQPTLDLRDVRVLPHAPSTVAPPTDRTQASSPGASAAATAASPAGAGSGQSQSRAPAADAAVDPHADTHAEANSPSTALAGSDLHADSHVNEKADKQADPKSESATRTPPGRALKPSAAVQTGVAASAEPLLHLAQLRLGFSLWRLVRADWVPVRAELRGLQLRADIDEVGHWSLHGFESQGGGDPSAAMRQLQRLKRLRLLDCELELHDVALPDQALSFRVRLADIQHRGNAFSVHADVQPPADMAASANLRGVLFGDLGEPASLDGSWTLSIDQLRGWPWLTQAFAADAQLRLGDARLSFDGTLKQGNVSSIEVRASAAEVAALRGDQMLAQIRKFEMHSRAQPTAQCWKAEISNLELDGARGHWSAGPGHYECTHDENGLAVAGDMNLLRLDDLAPWLGLWKDLPASAARVRDLRGDLHEVHIGTLPPDIADRGEPRTYVQFGARLEGGGLAGDAQATTLSGLNGRLQLDNDSGTLELDHTALQLALPETFQQALPVDALTTTLRWRHEGRDWHLWTPQFDWRLVGTEGRGQFDLLLAPNAPPHLSISADFSSADATLLKPYIPLTWKPHTRDWLSTALVKVAVPKAHLLLEGAMQDYPFTEPGSGRWALDLQLADATLAFSPNWAPIEHLQGLLALRGNGLSVDGSSAQIGGAQIDRVRAVIPDFHDAQLTVDGSVHGEGARFYEVLRASPLHQRLSGLLDKTDIAGAARLDLHLDMPLADEQQTRAHGRVGLDGAALTVHGLEQPIRSIVGNVDFSGEGVTADGVAGTFYKHPLTVDIHPQAGVPTGVLEAGTQLELDDSDGLASAYVPPWLRRHLSGSTQLTARLPLGGPEEGKLTIASDLRGVVSTLPPPLAKGAESALPVSAHLGSDAQASLRLGLEVADVMRVGLRFGDSAGGVRGVEMRLDGGAIPRAAADGIVVSGAPAELDLAPWIPFVTDIGAEGNPSDFSPAPGARKSLAFLSADLRPQRLLYGDFVVLQPHLHARPTEGGFRVDLDGESAQGSIDWSKVDSGHLTARLQRLKFEALPPRGDAAVNESAGNTAPPFAPSRAPTLDLRCDDLQAGDAKLGQLQLRTSRVIHGQQLDDLQLRGGDLQLDANGQWRRADDASSAELALSIEGGNIGAVFTAFGYPQTIAAKQTNARAALAWAPDPSGLRWQQARGDIELDLHKGDLKSVEPGAGRALGLFSLYALPRHLLLDFRDVFAKGLSFDQLAGKFALGDGQARTDDLEIKSPSLRVVMHGRIGLADRDYDEHVTVYPDVTTGVTIAGGIAGGPLGAGIALVAQEVLGKPFNKLSQFSYHVTGPWDNPQIKHGEAHKDECPEEVPADAKKPTDAQGKACSPRTERPAKTPADMPNEAPTTTPADGSRAAPVSGAPTDSGPAAATAPASEPTTMPPLAPTRAPASSSSAAPTTVNVPADAPASAPASAPANAPVGSSSASPASSSPDAVQTPATIQSPSSSSDTAPKPVPPTRKDDSPSSSSASPAESAP